MIQLPRHAPLCGIFAPFPGPSTVIAPLARDWRATAGADSDARIDPPAWRHVDQPRRHRKWVPEPSKILQVLAQIIYKTWIAIARASLERRGWSSRLRWNLTEVKDRDEIFMGRNCGECKHFCALIFTAESACRLVAASSLQENLVIQ